MRKLERVTAVIPGFVAALLVAIAAIWIESLLPIPLIGASVLALFIGMGINAFWKPVRIASGLQFTSKKVLKFAIILLGASLSIDTILNIGRMSLVVMCFTLLTCFGGGYFIGRALGINWKLSNLISAGTGICGGSAIAAISPVIEAKDRDIAYAMSATFLFDMVMILLFPLMGRWLGLSDVAYGLWSGTAVNDTSSVVAAGYAFSEAAGDFATMVKLTRTLSIIPVVIIFALLNAHIKKKEALAAGNGADASGAHEKVRFTALMPWFIVGFLALAAANSVGMIAPELAAAAKELSKFLMVAALGAIGLNTSFSEMRKSSPAPMLHGFIISALVVIVAIAVEYCMGIV